MHAAKNKSRVVGTERVNKFIITITPCCNGGTHVTVPFTSIQNIQVALELEQVSKSCLSVVEGGFTKRISFLFSSFTSKLV